MSALTTRQSGEYAQESGRCLGMTNTAAGTEDVPEIQPADLKFGLDTFGEIIDNDAYSTMRYVVDQAKLADEVGLHSFNVGEHHRDDYVISAPDIMLANIAAVTKNIHLGTAVIVLSSDDPVRVYERFSTIHALSNGRAELTVGRGSFTESFPLFGYELADYETLFEEKLAMLKALFSQRPVTWNSEHTQALADQEVYPELQGELPVYVAVGGSPQSVVRAAHHDLGLRLAVIGGDPERFAPFADLYRRAQKEFGHSSVGKVGWHSPGLVADTDEEAIEAFEADYMKFNSRVGAERGWPPMSHGRFLGEVQQGALFVGSVETVAEKITRSMKALGADTFDMKIGAGSKDAQLKSIELFGTKVVPMVRDMMSES